MILVRNLLLITAAAVFVASCATVDSPSYSKLAYADGVQVVPAVVKNPAPVCVKKIEFARLDKPADLQVYVDVRGAGEVCKK